MKVTTVSVTYGRKFNLGDYNSCHAEVSLWADLDEGDDLAEQASLLREIARNHVKQELSRVAPDIRVKVEGLLLGLPIVDGSNNEKGDR